MQYLSAVAVAGAAADREAMIRRPASIQERPVVALAAAVAAIQEQSVAVAVAWSRRMIDSILAQIGYEVART